MYIAFKKYKGQAHYILRASYTIDNKLTSRNLFDLGSDPSLFITYAGGNAFYFNEEMENAISALNPDFDSDELEDLFIQQEYILKSHELKSYVYTVFDLQSFFKSFMAKKMPHTLDQDKVDTYFLKEICKVNKALFNKKNHLDEYMIRYCTMFFDHQYAQTTLLDDFARAFMSQHRFFKPGKPQKSITTDKACKIFKLNKKELKGMTAKTLSKLYRKFARELHPDTGGSHDKFVELNNAYQSLLSDI